MAKTKVPATSGPSTETTPPDDFQTYMVALATDSAKLGEFIKDPDAAMKAAGISDADQLILKSGQPAAIHARLTGQKFSLTPPMPVTMLIVDLVRRSGAPDASVADQPTVRTQTTLAALAFPQQIFPQVLPQQIFPQQIFPQVHPLVIPPQQIFQQQVG